MAQLKPFDGCDVISDWEKADWPTEWKPSGDARVAVAAIYDQDVQIPDESPLLPRLRKLGASDTQRSRTKQFAISERVLDSFETTLHKLVPEGRDPVALTVTSA